MKKIVLVFILGISFLSVFSQDNTPKYTVPKDYSFTLPEDYEKYNPMVSEAIDWYLWRSMGFDADKRQEAGAFFLKWLIGTPAVTVDIDPKIVNFMNTNPELLLPFSMGWAKYSIDNNSKDRIKGCSAGIEAVVSFYRTNRGFLRKDDNVEKYEKMIKKNKLEDYIKKNLSELHK